MRAFYLFEFCDQPWVPSGARECLFEIMEACNSGWRSFNHRVALAALESAREEALARIFELGAGRAPITTHLATLDGSAGLTLVPCDLTPNKPIYRQLEARYPELVRPVYVPVDITRPQACLNDSVLVLAGVMHHIPFALRPAVLASLSRVRSRVLVMEPLKRTLLSMGLATLSLVPALMLPITFFGRPGKLRRFLWCWFVPIVPAMFIWDGVVSCLRQWSEREWRSEFDRLGAAVSKVEIRSGFNSLRIDWSGNPEADSDAESAA